MVDHSAVGRRLAPVTAHVEPGRLRFFRETLGESNPVYNDAAAAKKALEDANVRKRIEDTGSLIVANTPEQFAAQIKAEYEVYKKVVDTAKLKLD